MTKFYCPNKPIYYFFKINSKISTSFRQSMLISFWTYLNMYIINVIADDETKIGLYEIYFIND